ncbi:ASKHA domain-containing protein [Breznakiellaceae bacterium SP9]
MPRVSFFAQDKSIEVAAGTGIVEAARRAGVLIETPCNANGTCGKCLVRLNGKPVPACQTAVTTDSAIEVRDYADGNDKLQILAGGAGFVYEHKPFISKKRCAGNTEVYGGAALLGTERGDTEALCYGLAVDIGTTTLVTALVDLRSGGTVATESMLNPQSAYSQDVLGRIHFASKSEGLFTLHTCFSSALEAMIAKLAAKTGVPRIHIYELVYSGNTAMLHLACGVDPTSLGQFPYTPVVTGGIHLTAASLGLSPFARIWLPPIISSYVGADITSGILASRLYEKQGTVLFIDIGTNGELVLARNGKLAAASTAAGPAFEGMNISCGMRASPGAIEAFFIEDNCVSYDLIGGGNGAAVGICGSGLLDIVGELVSRGLVQKSGRFVSADCTSVPAGLKERLKQHEGKRAFFITDTVYLSQQDIRQVQLAKGAIRAGIELLLARAALDASNVDTVEIAGSFGYHLKEKSLLAIGLLPKEFAGKVAFVGNSSLSGGIAFLMNTDFRARMIDTVGQVDNVELSGDKDFEQTFITHMGF